MYTREQLTQAFITFRDSLPETHERRQTLQKFTSLRFDTITPNLLHLCSSDPDDDYHAYRRLILPTEKSLSEVAEDLVLFPPNTVVYGTASGDAREFILHLSPKLKEKYGVIDSFVSDHSMSESNVVVMLKSNLEQSPHIFDLLGIETIKAKDTDAYFIQHFVLSIAFQLQEMLSTSERLGELVFDPQMVQEVKAHWDHSPSFKPKVNQTLKVFLPYGLTMTQEDIKYLNEQAGLIHAGITPDTQTHNRIMALALNQVGIILVQTLETILPGLCDLDLPSTAEVKASQYVD